MIELVIEGEPTAKGRPRFYNGHTITPAKTSNYENYVKELYAINRLPRLEGYIKATITAYYGIPKSTSNKKRQQMINREIRPTKKPDLDNVAKIILDSLNNIAYKDDSQVVELIVKKYYNEKPCVILKLEEMEE